MMKSQRMSTSMEDLSESCVSMILSSTSAKDVCRLSATSKTFNYAANSDFLWKKFIPCQYNHLISRADFPSAFNSLASTKDLYFKLCSPVLFDDGKKLFWMDRSSGKLCYLLSARDLSIVWSCDRRYWSWVSHSQSSFKDVALLRSVCWFHVTGQFDCKLLSPGTKYNVSFRIKVDKTNNYDWSICPVSFKLKVPGKEDQDSARYLCEWENRGLQTSITPFRNVEDGWTEYDIGTLCVEDMDDQGIIEFSMTEIKGGNWKSGVLIEGVKIQPTSVLKRATCTQENQKVSNAVEASETSENFDWQLEHSEDEYSDIFDPQEANEFYDGFDLASRENESDEEFYDDFFL